MTWHKRSCEQSKDHARDTVEVQKKKPLGDWVRAQPLRYWAARRRWNWCMTNVECHRTRQHGAPSYMSVASWFVPKYRKTHTHKNGQTTHHRCILRTSWQIVIVIHLGYFYSEVIHHATPLLQQNQHAYVKRKYTKTRREGRRILLRSLRHCHEFSEKWH